MHMFFSIPDTHNSAGFALFYAVVVMAVISSLGAVLSSLIVREASLSATARESTRAYYSADAGMECAQYWDLQKNHFPDNDDIDKGDISCVGETGIDVTAAETAGGDPEYSFTIDTDSKSVCADVVITKKEVGARDVTQIDTFGTDDCSGDSRVQRALRTTY